MVKAKDVALDILEGLTGKGKLPSIHSHHNDQRAAAETERDNSNDEDSADEADARALDHEEKADRAKRLMARLAQRKRNT